jgi:uncharacterized repeat protein (TIGR03803 family)
MLDVLRTYWNGSRRLALACSLLLTLAAAPLHATQLTAQNLYNFNCNTGGCFPYDFGQLIQGTDGYLYGTASTGGRGNNGTVFKVSRDGTTYLDLWYFDGKTTGAFPYAALAAASDGNFYGTTSQGGKHGAGTLFRFNPQTNALTVLHHFTVAEGSPLTAPFQAVVNGSLYGVTGPGTTYSVTLAGVYKKLHNKAPGPMWGPFIYGSDLNLYGTTQTGGLNNLGTVFSMSPISGAINPIYNFSGGDGSAP